jgi:outer membrane protein assembly factor BamB
MPDTSSNEPSRKPLRLWPGIAAVALQWLGMFVLPSLAPDIGLTAFLVGAGSVLVVLLWWLFLSRAVWVERLGAVVLMVAGVFAASRLVHESVSNGMQGMMPIIYALPALSLALVIWGLVSRRLSTGPRRAALVAAILLACGALTVIRTEGIIGGFQSELRWRWTPTAEERLLAQGADEPRVLPPAPANTAPPETPSPETGGVAANSEDGPVIAPVETPGPGDAAPAPAPPAVSRDTAWPGFRGPERDGAIHGVRIETDWSRSPPVEVWRRAIGPGWSSFAVQGDRLYTQEQRGDDEVVSAYQLSTGQLVWRHADKARFWESNGGAGPRATPALGHGRVYTLGATGILSALNARDGSRVWSRYATADTGAEVPLWGIASSPLVVGDVVIAATAGLLGAYDAATGNPRWFGPKGGWGYSSPHLSTIGGVPQVVLLHGPGAVSVAPSDGSVLWKHEWPSDGMVQPAVLAGGDILIGSGSGLSSNTGMRRVAVAHQGDGWSVKERWTSTGLKPYFNDFVVHQGHAYGFDGSILAAIDVEDGKRKWKGGRYGHGQLVLLPEQDLLLVLSEEGELALVKAATDQFTEIARFKAIEGKTWNHPVLVGNLLLVRNGEEMAAFRLPAPGR